MTRSKPGIWSEGRQAGCPCGVPGRENSMCNDLVAREIATGIRELKEVPEATKVYSNKKDQKAGHTVVK